MIDKLFGSKTRIKLLHLFTNNPGQSFYVREITRIIDEQINSVRRELSNMLEVGVITSDSADNKLYYEVNQDYEFYAPLRAIFAGQEVVEVGSGATTPSGSTAGAVKNEDGIKQRYIDIIKEVPALRLAVFAGSLVQGSSSQIDVLLVGNLSSAKVASAIASIEKIEGRELNYSVLPYDEFYYRLSIRDRFIGEILNGKHSVALDIDNVL